VLSPLLLSVPAHGTLSFSGTGAFTYMPNSTFGGTDTFTYRARDGSGNGGTATVSIRVGPLAVDDTFSSTTRVVQRGAPGVLANDSGVSSLTAELVSAPSNWTVALNPDGSFSYSPDADKGGADSFTYRAKDAVGFGNTAKVSVSVPLPLPTFSGGTLSGKFVVSPASGTVTPGKATRVFVEWTVPKGSWHTLKTVELRFLDGTNFPVWIRYDEAANAAAIFDPDTGRFGRADPLGANASIANRFARMELRTSSARAVSLPHPPSSSPSISPSRAPWPANA